MPETTIIRGILLDLINSPDDGGFYWEEFNRETREFRYSKEVYPTRRAAKAAILNGTVVWEA